MDKTPDNLDGHYEFWDDYVSGWLNKEIKTGYLPEPWWGWTPESRLPLHSVVINLNPGVGGKLQTRRCMNCMWRCLDSAKYSESMDLLRFHLASTERWHLNRRYRTIMRALGVVEKKIALTTRNHLSIEISPEHWPINITNYIKQNATNIYKHVLCFAAKASRLIEPNTDSVPEQNLPHENPLKNIVLMRCAPEHINTLNTALTGDKAPDKEHYLRERKEYNYIDKTDKEGKPKAYVYTPEKEDNLKDVLFVCIPGVRNNFPGKENLQKIINHIINIKNNNQ